MQKWTEIKDIQKWVEMVLVIIGTVVCGNVLKNLIAFGSVLVKSVPKYWIFQYV
jgi:hypothetical protein